MVSMLVVWKVVVWSVRGSALRFDASTAPSAGTNVHLRLQEKLCWEISSVFPPLLAQSHLLVETDGSRLPLLIDYYDNLVDGSWSEALADLWALAYRIRRKQAVCRPLLRSGFAVHHRRR